MQYQMPPELTKEERLNELPPLPEPAAWFIRRWLSRKVELVMDQPNELDGEVTPLFTLDQVREIAAAIRSGKPSICIP